MHSFVPEILSLFMSLVPIEKEMSAKNDNISSFAERVELEVKEEEEERGEEN